MPKERWFLPDIELKDQSKGHLMIYDDDQDRRRSLLIGENKLASQLKAQLRNYFVKQIEQQKGSQRQVESQQDQQNNRIERSATLQPRASNLSPDQLRMLKQQSFETADELLNQESRQKINIASNGIQEESQSAIMNREAVEIGESVKMFDNHEEGEQSPSQIKQVEPGQEGTEYQDDQSKLNMGDFVTNPETFQQYLDEHPLKGVDPDTWNNIPVCIVKAFKSVIHHCMERDIDNWEKKAQINESFFRLQHMFLKVDKRQRDKYEMVNKALDYQQSTLTERMKKLETNFEQRFKYLDDQLLSNKRATLVEIDKCNVRLREYSNNIQQQVYMMQQVERQIKDDLQNEKLFMMKSQQNFQREILENHLIVTENFYEGENLTITKKSIKQYTIENMELVKNSIQETQRKIDEVVMKRFESEKLSITNSVKLIEDSLSKNIKELQNLLITNEKKCTNASNENQQIFEKYNQSFTTMNQDFENVKFLIDEKNFKVYQDLQAIMNDKLEGVYQNTTAIQELLTSQQNQINQIKDNDSSLKIQNEITSFSLSLSNVEKQIEMMETKIKKIKKENKKTQQSIDTSSANNRNLSIGSQQFFNRQQNTNSNNYNNNNLSVSSPKNQNQQQNNNNPMSPSSQKSQRSKRSIATKSKGGEDARSSHQGKQSSMSKATTLKEDSRIQKIVNESFNNRVQIFRDLVKQEIELHMAALTSIRSHSNNPQSRLFSAAHEYRKPGVSGGGPGVGVFSLKNITSETTKYGSFDNFKHILSERHKNEQSLKEWARKINQMQTITLDDRDALSDSQQK